MRLATLLADRGTTAAVHLGGGWRTLPAPDLSALLATGTPWSSLADLAGATVENPRHVLPLPAPGKVICCGLTYGEHIKETGRAGSTGSRCSATTPARSSSTPPTCSPTSPPSPCCARVTSS